MDKTLVPFIRGSVCQFNDLSLLVQLLQESSEERPKAESRGDDRNGVTDPEEHLRSSLMTSGKDVADPPPNIPTTLGNTGKLNIFESIEDRPKTESRGDETMI